MKEYFRQKLVRWREELMRETGETISHLQEESLPAPICRPGVPRSTAPERAPATAGASSEQDRRCAERIEETYGYCEETEEPISIRRLEACPIATSRSRRRSATSASSAPSATTKWAGSFRPLAALSAFVQATVKELWYSAGSKSPYASASMKGAWPLRRNETNLGGLVKDVAKKKAKKREATKQTAKEEGGRSRKIVAQGVRQKLEKLQVELCRLQTWVVEKACGLSWSSRDGTPRQRGRDQAHHRSRRPRVFRVVALPA